MRDNYRHLRGQIVRVEVPDETIRSKSCEYVGRLLDVDSTSILLGPYTLSSIVNPLRIDPPTSMTEDNLIEEAEKIERGKADRDSIPAAVVQKRIILEKGLLRFVKPFNNFY